MSLLHATGLALRARLAHMWGFVGLRYIVATKANPFQKPFGETLRPESVKKQVCVCVLPRVVVSPSVALLTLGVSAPGGRVSGGNEGCQQ